MARRPSSRLLRLLRAAALLALLPLVFTAYAVYGHFCDLALLLPLFPRRRRLVATRLADHWGNTLFSLGTSVGGAVITQRGRFPERGERPVLVVANHQSLLDIPLLFRVCRGKLPRFVLKRELRWGIPNVSPATRAAGFAFVDRRPGARAQNLASLTRFAELLVEDGATGVLFPEGTWEPEGEPLPFRPTGLRALLAAAPFDILPVVIEGSFRAQTFLDFLRRLGDLHVAIVVGPLIPSAEARDLDALLPRLEAALRATLIELRSAPENAFDPREIAS